MSRQALLQGRGEPGNLDHAENGSAPSFVVGIGASAGGLEALERFFQAVPLDTGMAFVVIQHLSPDFKSLMDELLARFTKIPIVRVVEPVTLQGNHIYLLPPRKEIVVEGGQLHPYDKPTDQPLSMPINTFFRSLARELGERGIAIVLSGTGSDGSLGLGDVHNAGGLVLAQSEETAKFDGMPRSALATGQVDAVMAPEDMPKALVAYAKSPSSPLLMGSALSAPPVMGLPAIIDRLREVYGIDFNHYKPATISRRIDRRVAMGRAASVQAYCATVLKDADELDALYRDLLIGVTRFFRDPEAYAVLENTVIPEIVDALPRGEEVRVWVPACATGEEPYSLAILFIEAFDARGREPALKVFASDVHRDSLQFAADGRYSSASLAELTEARQERFFEREVDGSYRVSPQLRRHILFSPHNVIRDPPFTRMDLVSCRNMLIYLQPPAQLKALAAFHFALKHRAILLLGPSEGVSDLQAEFEPIDRQWKVYRKISDARLPMDLRIELMPSPLRAGPRGFVGADSRLGRIYENLLKRFAPSAVLVDPHNNVMHVFGNAERFLQLPAGRMTTDITAMTRGDMRVAISSAIQHALKRSERVAFYDVRCNFGQVQSMDIIAEPLSDGSSNLHYVLVLLSPREASRTLPESADKPEAVLDIATEARHRIQQLESELQHAKESLQATVEELETSNEELQASNEELLAANEELQSTNEELHSVNEELYSVNAEHEQKIKDLNRVSSDLKNLIQSTEIGTIFLDGEQRIRFFTPAAGQLFNLMAQDIDRDIRHITSRVENDDVFEDISRVRATSTTQEKRIRTAEGRIYLRRIMPYFDASRLPSGFILTFVDITDLFNAEEAVRRTNRELEARVRDLDAANQMHKLIFDGAPDGILTVNEQGIVLMVNAQAEQLFGYAQNELVGLNVDVLVPEVGRKVHQRHRNSFFGNPDKRRMGQTRWLEGQRKDGTAVAVQVTLVPLEQRGVKLVMAFITDMTRTRQLETERDQLVQKMTEAQKLESLGILAGGIAHDFNNLLTGIMATAGMLVDSGGDQEEVRESSRLILESTRRAAELCHQLLAYSGRSKFVLRARDVNDLIEATSKLAQASSVRKNARLTFDLTPDLPPVLMDETQIRQVIMNLVINAAEAVDPLSGIISIRTGQSVLTPAMLRSAVLATNTNEGEYVFVEVQDNGCGIRPDDIRRIFEPFYTTKFTGRGLGLSAVLGIVRGHGGVLTVSSDIGKGATFRVLLPIAQSAEEFVTAPSKRTTKSLSVQGKVLVADDEPAIRSACRRLLNRMGVEADLANDGHDALVQFSKNAQDYCAVILDLTMPGLSGAAVFAEIKRLQPTMPVILMSGFSQEDIKASVSGEVTPDAFLPKPFDHTALAAALQEALKGSA